MVMSVTPCFKNFDKKNFVGETGGWILGQEVHTFLLHMTLPLYAMH